MEMILFIHNVQFGLLLKLTIFCNCNFYFRKFCRYVEKSGLILFFPFPPIENDRKWLYQLLQIKYELKLPSETTPGRLVIQIQI